MTSRPGSDPFAPAWLRWWEVNAYAFLNLRAHVHRAPYRSSDVIGFHVDPESAAEMAPFFPTAKSVRQQHLPLLLKQFAEADQKPVRRAYLLALARSSRALPVNERDTVVAILRKELGSKDRETADTAAVALSWTAHRDAARILVQVVHGGKDAREWFRNGKVPLETQLQAILGLGRIAAEQHEDLRRFVLTELWRVALGSEDGLPNRRVAAFAAIGLAPLPWSNAPDAADRPGTYQHEVDRLVERFLDLDERTEVRAQCLSSWADWMVALDEPQRELEKQRFLPVVLARMRPELDDRILEAAVVALGSLVDSDEDPLDRRAVELLLDLSQAGPPRWIQQRRWMELARIAARGGDAASKSRERIVEALLETVLAGRMQDRTWAVLSLGRLGHELRWRGEDLGDGVRSALRVRLTDKPSADEEAVLCLTLGWLHDLRAQSMLEERFNQAAQLRVRAFAALGLGLLGEPSGLAVLNEAQGRTTLPSVELERAVTLARALLEDRDIGLVRVRDLDRSVAVEAKLAQLNAIGEVGDVRALPPLMALAASSRETGLMRAAGVAAAGRVAEPDLLTGAWRYALDTSTAAWPADMLLALSRR